MQMLWVISIIALLSCAIDCGFANEVADSRTANSSCVHAIVTDLDKTGTSVVIKFIMDVILLIHYAGGLLHRSVVERTVSEKSVEAIPTKPKHAKPKLCNGHLGKQECSFKAYSRSSSQNNLTQETALLDIFNLSIVLCSTVMLPISYILFITLQK